MFEIKLVFPEKLENIIMDQIDDFQLLVNLEEDGLLKYPIKCPYQLRQYDHEILCQYLETAKIDLKKVGNIDMMITILNWLGDIKLRQQLILYLENIVIKTLPLDERCYLYRLQHLFQIGVLAVDGEILERPLRNEHGGLYLSTIATRDFQYEVPVMHISKLTNEMRLPIVKFSSRFKPTDPCLMEKTANYEYNGCINLDAISWLRNFPWSEFPTIGIAGGFVITSLQGQFNSTQDIDLYIPNTSDSKRVLNKLIAYFQYKFGNISFQLPLNDYPSNYEVYMLKQNDEKILLQIILSPCSSMLDIVSQFDLSHLGLWIDNGGLWCLQSSYFELINKFTTIRHHASQSRILKYAQRGFDIYGLRLDLYVDKNPLNVSWTSTLSLPREINLNVNSVDYHIGYLERAPRFKLAGYPIRKILENSNNEHTYGFIKMYIKITEDSPFEGNVIPYFINCKVSTATCQAYNNLLSTVLKSLLGLSDENKYHSKDNILSVYCDYCVSQTKILPKDTILEIVIYHHILDPNMTPYRPKLIKIY